MIGQTWDAWERFVAKDRLDSRSDLFARRVFRRWRKRVVGEVGPMKDVKHPAECSRFWRPWCVLTDHAFTVNDTAPEPFCRRCGWSDYWPVRRTMRRSLESAGRRVVRFLDGNQVPW